MSMCMRVYMSIGSKDTSSKDTSSKDMPLYEYVYACLCVYACMHVCMSMCMRLCACMVCVYNSV